MPMDSIFLDIETLPVRNKKSIDLLVKNLKAPANYSKPEAIEAWIAKNKEAEIRKTSFKAEFGSVLCIGYAINDEPAECIYLPEKEKKMLNDFIDLTINDTGKKRVLIGHHIRGFDAPYISRRMMIHGLGPLFPFGTKSWDMKIECTGEMFMAGEKGKMPKLETLCNAFKVKTPKDGIDGSQVYDFFLEGKHEEIADYCKRDVEATREVYRKMTK